MSSLSRFIVYIQMSIILSAMCCFPWKNKAMKNQSDKSWLHYIENAIFFLKKKCFILHSFPPSSSPFA